VIPEFLSDFQFHLLIRTESFPSYTISVVELLRPSAFGKIGAIWVINYTWPAAEEYIVGILYQGRLVGSPSPDCLETCIKIGMACRALCGIAVPCLAECFAAEAAVAQSANLVYDERNL